MEPPDVGSDGPLKVSPALHSPLGTEFKSACNNRGYPITYDIFDGTVNGMTHLVRSIYQGIRSISMDFIQGRPNNTIKTSTMASKGLPEGQSVIGLTGVA